MPVTSAPADAAGAIEQHMYDALSPDERATLRSLLRKYADATHLEGQ